MNTLLIDILKGIGGGANLTTTLKVIDYVLCTTPIAVGEEGEVLTVLLEITNLLSLDWHPVFDVEIVSLACEGKAPGKDGGLPIDKPIGILHKGLCAKRAALYKEKEPSISDMGDGIRPTLLTISGVSNGPTTP